MEESDRLKLKIAVDELAGYRGRHTEMVTVYAAAGSNINQIITQLVSEQSTAMNIKSKNTRKNVIDALEKLIRHLKLYKQIPENGLALFCGNISETEGQPDIQIWAIEPPKPLKIKFYRCDQTFVLEPLQEMLESTDVFGLIVVDRKEATFGVLDGKTIKTIRHLTSGIPSKFKAGGQSAQRFERIRDELTKEFFRRVSEHAKEIFFTMPKLKSLIVGGPGPTKEDWLKDGNLITALQKKILAIKDIGYADEHGLELLVENSQEELAKESIIAEKIILEQFFSALARTPEKTAYGLENVKRALEGGAVEKLLLSTTLDQKLSLELEKAAAATASEVHFISVETNEGLQFKNLAGVGAILRFAI
jgi:peptide chain release factor subunit 1